MNCPCYEQTTNNNFILYEPIYKLIQPNFKSIFKYISEDKYTYKYIVLYIINLSPHSFYSQQKNSSPHVHKFVHEHIIMFELDLFNNYAYS